MHLGHCRGIRGRVCPGYKKPTSSQTQIGSHLRLKKVHIFLGIQQGPEGEEEYEPGLEQDVQAVEEWLYQMPKRS